MRVTAKDGRTGTHVKNSMFKLLSVPKWNEGNGWLS